MRVRIVEAPPSFWVEGFGAGVSMSILTRKDAC